MAGKSGQTAQAKSNQRLVTDPDNNLQKEALSTQNGGWMEESGLITLTAKQGLNRARDQVEIIPEGEGRVDRVQPQTTPDWYEVVVERPPRSWEMQDPVLVAKENGFEISPNQGSAEELKKRLKVRMRIPYGEYLKRVAAGEKKSEDMRRAKTKDATVDNVKRTAIDLQELFSITGATQGSDLETASQMVEHALLAQE